MQLLNANVKAKAVGVNRTQGIVNYLVGKDRRKWHVGIPMFTKIQYAQIYPGIDLVYYGNQRQLEYDFVVRPGADPRTISLGFQGIKTASLLQTGDVAVELDGGKITLNKPGVYQMIRGKRRNVDGRYTFHGSQAIGIEVGLYDRNQPLI